MQPQSEQTNHPDESTLTAEADCSPLPKELRGRYQLPDTTMTLREGLAEYYAVNPGLSDPKNIKDPRSATYFHRHDCTHVVFGTHTNILNETVNDMWTLLGVDITWRAYMGGFFATDEATSISKEAFKLSIIPIALRGLSMTPEIWRRTRAMTKKWPWAPTDAMLDRSLVELRREYGIRVFTASELEPSA